MPVVSGVPQLWRGLVALTLLAALTGCRSATNTASSPDLVSETADPNATCTAARLAWETRLANPANFCASLLDSDIPRFAPFGLNTSRPEWQLIVPQLPDIFPASSMEVNFNLLSYTWSKPFGPDGAQFDVKFEERWYVIVPNPDRLLFVPIFKLLVWVYAVPASDTFDPHHPWAMSPVPSGRILTAIDGSQIGFIDPEAVLQASKAFIPRAVACADRARGGT